MIIDQIGTEFRDGRICFASEWKRDRKRPFQWWMPQGDRTHWKACVVSRHTRALLWQRPFSRFIDAQQFRLDLLAGERALDCPSFDTDVECYVFTVVSYTSTGTSTFLVPTGVTSVEVLGVAGGGGGGSWGGGGGAGGVFHYSAYTTTPGDTLGTLVGTGGTGCAAGATSISAAGGNSTFNSSALHGSTLTAKGGGCGGTNGAPNASSGSGGSSGGLGASGPAGAGTVGSATQPGTNSGATDSGYVGGVQITSGQYPTGGGGGASAVGGAASGTACGAGGAGIAYSTTGTSATYGGGGGGGGGGLTTSVAGAGGAGGGAAGTGNANGNNGTANTGGGGGGSGNPSYAGGTGGSGFIALSYTATSSVFSTNMPMVGM